MSNVIHTGQHWLHRCADDAKKRCFLCSFNIKTCQTCGGSATSLPTHCPNRLMTKDEIQKINNGQLDYHRKHSWINQEKTNDNRIY